MSNSRQKSKNEIRQSESSIKKPVDEFVAAPLLSQVPYLNGVFDDEETMREPYVVYVRETDSEYIRRCKLGGNRDLLVYIDPATCRSKEPVPYPRPLWWDAMCEDIPLSTHSSNGQHQEKRAESKKTEHVAGTTDKVIHDEPSRSSDKPQTTASRQSRLSTNTKRK